MDSLSLSRSGGAESSTKDTVGGSVGAKVIDAKKRILVQRLKSKVRPATKGDQEGGLAQVVSLAGWTKPGETGSQENTKVLSMASASKKTPNKK